MAGNPFDSPTVEMMYRDALQSLYNGAVMPWDREILAIAPLPADVVDPFASQDVDPLQIMGFAYNSLVTWIDEARKANYFSKRFTDLSKLVLKGVMTMGRGLVTLHNRGEDLSRAPMQIGDLISVGSYHFRKSYLGVIQTAKSHPEISERLLVNQLSWTNMLLRLYKTKEKLAKPVSNEEVRSKNEELPENKKPEIGNKISASNEEVRMKNEELPDGNSDNSSFLLHNSSLNDDTSFLPLHSSSDNGSSFDKNDANPFSEVDALFEPAALSAPRALRSLEGNKKSETSENKKSEIRNKRNEEVRKKNEETESGDRDQVSGVRDSGTRIEDQGTSSNEEERTTDNEDVRMKNEESNTDSVGTEKPKPVSDIITNEEEKPGEDELPEGNDDSSFLPLHSSLDDDSSSDDLPPYLQILRNAFGRSEPNEEGRLTFTFDEIRYLASNPDFARIYPDAAADMRKIQMQIDTG